jgi:hypothetical protein
MLVCKSHACSKRHAQVAVAQAEQNALATSSMKDGDEDGDEDGDDDEHA